MIVRGPLPTKLVEPLARALAARGISEAHIVTQRSGKQGTCFVIEVHPGGEKVVLKVMEPSRPRNTPDSVEREYRALERFYESSRSHSDVGIPEPIGLFREQRGYLMSYVEATSVEDLLGADLLGEEEIRTVAGRIASALELYHQSVGEMYGDFHPLNVLVRPSLEVVLIDPTPTSPFQESVGEGLRHSPASADLGYWAYSVAARSVKQILKGSRLPARLYGLTSELMTYAGRPHSEYAEAFSDAVYQAAGRYVIRLKSQPRFKDRVLGSLTQSRLRVLRSQSHKRTGISVYKEELAATHAVVDQKNWPPGSRARTPG
jgi:hypothetical protein